MKRGKQAGGSITRALEHLYGPAAARRLRPRLHSLLETARRRLGLQGQGGGATLKGTPGSLTGPSEARAPTELSQRDALLICHPDQVHEAGVPPLRSLAAFAKNHLQGLVSGIHLLPFYPWSSDDGFSVKDYFAVDARYGSWDDVRWLRAGFDLMFDAVINHASVEGEWFKNFLAGDPEYRDFFVTVSGNPDLSQVVRPRALPLLTAFPAANGPRRVWTTFGPDQVDLNFRNPEVLLRIIDGLLIGLCAKAPVVLIEPNNFLYGGVGPDDVEEIIEETIQNHRPVERLAMVQEGRRQPRIEEVNFYKGQQRRVLENCGRIDPTKIEHAIETVSADDDRKVLAIGVGVPGVS